MGDQGVLFSSRFLEQLAGPKLLSDPRSAMAELVANAWDAGATEVSIEWPADRSGGMKIVDNGHGMTSAHVEQRWRTLSYDRLKHQGDYAELPPGVKIPPRPVFGRNGLGRFSAFCFGRRYTLSTERDGIGVRYEVSRGETVPFRLNLIEEYESELHGTTIEVSGPLSNLIAEDELRAAIGLRFLTDPRFRVTVNGIRIRFEDIPSHNVTRETLDVGELGTVEVIVIDVRETDRSTKHHGVAWHVKGRLVGDCSWRSFGDQAFIDGRRSAAKRYTFIVLADILADAVAPDWGGFLNTEDSKFHAVNDVVTAWVRKFLLDVTKEQRERVYQHVRAANLPLLESVGPLARDRWVRFVRAAQEQCPSLSESDLGQLAKLLASLEQSSSKYALVSRLSRLDPTQLDDLDRLLGDWTVDMAKIVLDELQTRMALVNEMARATQDPEALEVETLQPIFERGLWIFGPEYETIEFTSNRGMTTVIQELFGGKGKGSRNRPDFVILPDGSASCYWYPRYDDDGSEIGAARVTIVELKKAGVIVSTDAKDQCWRYVKELYKRGLVTDETKTVCFVLGQHVDPVETQPRTERDRRVIIQPMPYDIVLARAQSRLLRLFDRVKQAPFLQDADVQEFCAPIVSGQLSLDVS